MNEREGNRKKWALLRNTPDLESTTELERLKEEVREIVTTEYAEFGQEDQVEMIAKESTYKFDRALRYEREKRKIVI